MTTEKPAAGTHKTVVTHYRRFHGDEVVAFAILRLAGFKLKLKRVARNAPDIHEADFKLDIGRRHAPEDGYFDHHQTKGAGHHRFPPPLNIPYATAGLVWNAYGLAICDGNRALFRMVEKGLILHVDAADVGEKHRLKPAEIPLAKLIAQHNDDDVGHHKAQHRRFLQAARMTQEILANYIRNCRHALERAQVIENAITNRGSTQAPILKVDQLVEWRDSASLRLLNRNNIEVLVMPAGDEYVLHLVRPEHTFPPSWRTLNKEGMQRLVGRPDGVTFTTPRHARAPDIGPAERLAESFVQLPQQQRCRRT